MSRRAAVERRLRRAGCVFAEDETDQLLRHVHGSDALEWAVRRREAGEPLEHVLGRVELAGVRVRVVPPVFVPRPRSAVLVDAAAADLRAGLVTGPVLDLGCGCGVLAAALARLVPAVQVLATDVDPDAVACAETNADTFGFTVHRGHWFGGLPLRLRGRLGLVLAYLPHVPTEALQLLPLDRRRAERDVAVHGGADGLDPLREVLTELGGWLASGGRFLTLLAAEQVESARALAATTGWWATVQPVGDGDALLRVTRRVGEITPVPASSEASTLLQPT